MQSSNPASSLTSVASSDAPIQILQKAEAARVAAAGKPYTVGGNDTIGFDCSGFVIYVFNQAYGTNTLADVTANELRTQGRFPAVQAPPKPGDLVFFSASAGGTTASHAAIVVDANRWISSQSSTGVAYVQFSNPYWHPRILSYGRYQPLQAANAIIPMFSGKFASMMHPAGRGGLRRV